MPIEGGLQNGKGVHLYEAIRIDEEENPAGTVSCTGIPRARRPGAFVEPDQPAGISPYDLC